MLHLAAPEQDGDLDLVVVFEELAGLGNLGVDVVLAGLGADADLLQLLLTDLATLVVLLRVFESQLAVVENLADGRALVGSYLHQIEPSLPSHREGLSCGHQAQLLAFGTDQADRTYADVFVRARATILRGLTVEMTNRKLL